MRHGYPSTGRCLRSTRPLTHRPIPVEATWWQRQNTVRLLSICSKAPPRPAVSKAPRQIVTGLAVVLSLSAGHALAQTPPSTSEQIRDLLNSEQVQSETQRQRSTNAQIISGVQTPWVLPTHRPTPASPASPAASTNAPLQALGAGMANSLYLGAQQLRYGRHNTITPDSEPMLETLRQSVSGPEAQQAQAWAQVKILAARGVPEATHFVGYVVEHGLKGERPDPQLAARYYAAASARGYQAALFNLGLQAAYGRGTRQDLATAVNYMVRAADRGSDDSMRVCGMGSFLALRAADLGTARRLAQGCESPLAALVDVRANPVGITPQRISLLRQVIATGADDGYAALIELGRANIATDRQLLYCKYRLLAELRDRPQGADVQAAELRARALRCAQQVRPSMPKELAASIPDAQLADALASFSIAERAALQTMRESSTVHYGRSVPFLPFRSAEAEVFEPAITAALKRWAPAGLLAKKEPQS